MSQNISVDGARVQMISVMMTLKTVLEETSEAGVMLTYDG